MSNKFLKDDVDKIVITYNVWRNLFRRCYVEKCEDYKNYGARGIKVCDQWHGEDGFWSFLNDVGLRQSKKLSLDRIDVNKGYSPENVRWATSSEQGKNKRNNVLITFNGETMNISRLAMNSEISYQALWKLIVVKKVSPENAVKILKTPKQATISEIARKANLKPATLMRRLRVGVPMDLAISAPLKAGVKTLRANNGC